jgi:hypothetical protein
MILAKVKGRAGIAFNLCQFVLPILLLPSMLGITVCRNPSGQAAGDGMNHFEVLFPVSPSVCNMSPMPAKTEEGLTPHPSVTGSVENCTVSLDNLVPKHTLDLVSMFAHPAIYSVLTAPAGSHEKIPRRATFPSEQFTSLLERPPCGI